MVLVDEYVGKAVKVVYDGEYDGQRVERFLKGTMVAADEVHAKVLGIKDQRPFLIRIRDIRAIVLLREGDL